MTKKTKPKPEVYPPIKPEIEPVGPTFPDIPLNPQGFFTSSYKHKSPALVLFEGDFYTYQDDHCTECISFLHRERNTTHQAFVSR